MSIASKILNEYSINSIRAYVNQKTPFALITAYRGNRTPEDNERRNEQLRADLRSFGLHALDVDGYYQERGMDAPSHEKSFFVPYLEDDEPRFKQFIIKLVQKYGQDCAAYHDGFSWGLLYPNGRREIMGHNVSFNPADIKVAWTRLRGKPFVLV